MRLRLEGETFTLMAERCAYWHRERTLFLADPHFGKSESFRALGVPVPSGSNASTLTRINQALHSTGADRLIILGDFWHARSGITEELLTALDDWRNVHSNLTVELVLGNHDGGERSVPKSWGFTIHSDPCVRPPFVLAHYPRPSPSGYVLSGHLHPALQIRGRGRQSLRLPCFWFGASVGVLPAFGSFTGSALVEPLAGDRLFVVADNEVIEFPDSAR